MSNRIFLLRRQYFVLLTKYTIKLQELASLSEKSTEQSKGYETKIKDIEGAMEERKHTLEKIEIARDALTMQLRNLEQTLQEKDIQVEVSFLTIADREVAKITVLNM